MRTSRSLLERLDRSLGLIEWVSVVLAGSIIFMMMLLVTAEVLSRRLFNWPIPGQVDLVTVTMVGFGVLCISYCWSRAGHIRMDLVVNALSGRRKWVLELIITLVALGLISAVLPGSWRHFMRAYTNGDSTIGFGLPIWPSKLAVPVGLAILWLRLLLESFGYVRLIRDPQAQPVAIPSRAPPGDEMDA